MKYKNAGEILPDDLLSELQRYVSGETIYVPRAIAKKPWGEVSGARRYYRERNEKIREKYRAGASVDSLAEEFSLSPETIRKIVFVSSTAP